MFLILSKVFSVLLAGIAISKSYVDFRARVESLQMFLVWTFTWTGIVLVALFPSIVDIGLSSFGSRAGLGTFFGMALVFLFFVVYRIYVKLDRLEQKLTKTIQELSLRDWNNRRSGS
jgi:small membrane protein